MYTNIDILFTSVVDSLCDNIAMAVDKHEMHEKECALKGHMYPEIDCHDFYRDIFPLGSFERAGHQEDCKPNGLALAITQCADGTSRGRHRIIFDDLSELEQLSQLPFVIISPISYFGRSRKATNASLMYALTLDIDYVNAENLCWLLNRRINTKPMFNAVPEPTYIVNSGHGLHLYYVFERPIPMYPDNQKELLRLKQFLVNMIWDKYTSYKPQNKECLGLVQGFRMVGGASKVPGEVVKAFKTGKKCTVEWLESFDRSNGLNINIKQKQGLSLDEAKQLYPQWYEKRVVKGARAGIPNWRPKRDLYDWWLRKANAQATYGHRYFCVMALAIFAIKCGIEREELEKDALKLQKELTGRGDKPFTVADTFAALEAYNEDYRTFPRASLERLTAIEMPANKRNGRTQAEHLARNRVLQEFDDPNGEWRNKNGRPKGSTNKRYPKKDLILDYAKQHPDATQRQIAKVLGISLPTVNKWLKAAKDNT